jgi:YD repeat-containing protein
MSTCAKPSYKIAKVNKSIFLVFFLIAISLLAFVFIPDSAQSQANLRMTTYQYDNAGRLIKAVYPSGKEIIFRYDKPGNLLERRIADEGTEVNSWSLW